MRAVDHTFHGHCCWWPGDARSHCKASAALVITHGAIFYSDGLTLIPTWISNHMTSKVCDKIHNLFPNLNGCTVEVWKWISYFILWDNSSRLGLKLNHVSKSDPVNIPVLASEGLNRKFLTSNCPRHRIWCSFPEDALIIEAETKWTPFRRRYIQTNFHEWKC